MNDFKHFHVKGVAPNENKTDTNVGGSKKVPYIDTFIIKYSPSDHAMCSSHVFCTSCLGKDPSTAMASR